MSFLSLIQVVAIIAIPVIFAITVHEVAHGWVASKLGDQTAKQMGRLTLNPIKHMDPVGTVLLPLIMLMAGGVIFGWAKPVPVDWRNLRHPRRDMAWVALAGPVANFIMLVIWAFLAKVIVSQESGFFNFALPITQVGISINTVLLLLNLIPVPPLDGSRIVTAFLSPAAAVKYNRLEPYGLFIIIILIVIFYDYFFQAARYMENFVSFLVG